MSIARSEFDGIEKIPNDEENRFNADHQINIANQLEIFDNHFFNFRCRLEYFIHSP